MANAKKQKLVRRTLIRGFWSLMFIGIFSVILLFLMASWGAFGKLPTFEELENPDLAVATEVYSSDGELLGKIYRKNRVNITYNDLPQHLVNAIVDTEDERFYNHSGIDMRSTGRAVALLGRRGGGSTITQQLAKNLLEQGRGEHTVQGYIGRVFEKSKEYIVALKLEKRYTKQEILAMYLNQFDFVNNAIGIQTASKVYFNKHVNELDTIESAVFAGMLNNPSAFNPRQNPKDSKVRRNVVLYQMHRNGDLTKEERDSLMDVETVIDFNLDDHNSGLAPYMRSYIQNEFLPNWVKNNPKVDGSTYDIYRDGLKVYTSVDSRMQAIAEKAVSDQLQQLQKKFDKVYKNKDLWSSKQAKTALGIAISNSERYNSIKRAHKDWSRERVIEEMKIPVDMRLYDPVKGSKDTLLSPLDSIKYNRALLQSAFLVTEPTTGQIKAWVGGRNFRYFKYDHTTTKRQVGSTFKPFLYSVAIENGWAPCYTVPNLPVQVVTATGKVWSPKNSGVAFDGRPITLKYGLSQSMNNISAALIKEIGPRPVITLAERAGLKDVPEVYSIALGTTEQSVQDLTQAYTMFANKGVSIAPYVVTRIEDKNGNIIQEFSSNQVTEVISPQLAYTMLQMMRGVVTGGTAQRIGWQWGLDNFIAGKTGTTNDNTDAWFVGLTPQLMGVVWTGADDNAIHFPTWSGDGQGARSALPIWGQFFRDLYKRQDEFGIKQYSEFEMPANMTVSLNCDATNMYNPLMGPGTTYSGSGEVIPQNTVSTGGDTVKPKNEEEDFE